MIKKKEVCINNTAGKHNPKIFLSLARPKFSSTATPCHIFSFRDSHLSNRSWKISHCPLLQWTWTFHSTHQPKILIPGIAFWSTTRPCTKGRTDDAADRGADPGDCPGFARLAVIPAMDRAKKYKRFWRDRTSSWPHQTPPKLACASEVHNPDALQTSTILLSNHGKYRATVEKYCSRKLCQISDPKREAREISAGHVRWQKSPVPIAKQNAKYPLSQRKAGRYTAGIASQNTGNPGFEVILLNSLFFNLFDEDWFHPAQ